MSYLRGSPNHIWSTTCILGRGATATVYQGVNKKTGDPVAVKTFNKLSLDRPQNVQMREFDVLRKVNHENIVKLIAIEEDLESASKVLVMELCTGGSLFSILDDPMNSYGLEEDEFLLVLKDLTAGMKHLRDNNIIHRDLKPGNIMKFVAENGTSIYKLTDFGAARELEEDQQFMSLYGTEEYLHPHMYERAVLRKPGEKLFSSNVDLWSIGVTLYHVATGSLPFRPYGGRRNRDCMHFITTKKESGVISGVQKDHSTSSIEWGRDLPKTCLLSGGLKELVVLVLAGLMECDSLRMWSFDQFFDEVTQILSCKRLHAFYVNECREYVLYIPSPERDSTRLTFPAVCDQILKQTQVTAKQQLVIFEKQLFENYLSQSFNPVTTLACPLYIFNIESKDVRLSTVQNVQGAKFPEFTSSTVNLDEDASIGKTWCSITHVTKRLIERLLRAHNHIGQAPIDLALIIEDKASSLKNHLKFTKQTVNALDRQLTRSTKCQQQICELASLVPTHCQELDRLKRLVTQKSPVRTLFESVSRAEKEIDALEVKVLSPRSLQKQWNDRRADGSSVDGCLETASTLVNKIRDNWQALARDKVTKKLNYHDEQFHILEKHKMQQTSLKLMSLLQERCLKPTHRLAQKLQAWHRDTSQIYRSCLQLKLALNSFSDMTTWYGQALKTEEEFDSIVDQFINTIKAFSTLNVASTPLVTLENLSKISNKPEVSSKTLLNELEELKRQQNEILQIVEESQEIMQNVLSLSSASN